MRHLKTLAAVFTAATLVATGGCGGSSHGFAVTTNPIVITSTAMPPTLSGQVVNIPLAFSGGYGGPYLITVLSGAWRDTNSNTLLSSGNRTATDTTVNAAFLTGIVASSLRYSSASLS